MSTYQPKRGAQPHGLHVPYDRGYDAEAFANVPTADQVAPSGFLIRPNGEQIGLWITEISADFSVSGSSGQSRMVREYFPHSFNDVTLRITGNVSSTYEYNRLALFVREHQWFGLQYINQGGKADQMITFVLNNDYPTADGSAVPQTTPLATKGPHRPWRVSGYVNSIAAGAVSQTQEVAPEFSIDLIVCESKLSANTGIWADSLDTTVQSLKTMLEILSIKDSKQRAAGAGFVTDPISNPKPTPVDDVRAAVATIATDLGWSAQAVASTITGGLGL